MSACIYCSLIAIIPYLIAISSSHPQLKHYEILNKADLINPKDRSKRSINGALYEREVLFNAYDNEFHLMLNPKLEVLSSHFRAYSVDKHGHKKEVFIDRNQFYGGFVYSDTNSSVSAQIDENGLLTASIKANGEQFIVEPSWRYNISGLKNDSMIIYKTDDVLHSWNQNVKNQTKFCEFIKLNEESNDEENVFLDTSKLSHKRTKRQFLSDDTEELIHPINTQCALLLVADYLFYRTIGGENQKTTINFLINLIDRVNDIFLNTAWKDDETQTGFKGMGFVIKEIHVHDEPTDQDTLNVMPEYYYNTEKDDWNVRELLERFSRRRDNKNFCLAHLFTHRSFEKSVLGLAYVASPRPRSIGGICSPSHYKGDGVYFFNTGLTTTKNSIGRVITKEMMLVTAHEFGHNWGSEHDPHTKMCSPGADDGGSYLMYTYSVSGYDPNNKHFSPCSRRSIKAVLLAKSERCFSKPDEAYCGNSKVEEGEECDEGIIGDSYHQHCCDKNCLLRPGADCSDRNSPCCRNCKISPFGNMCRAKDQNNCKDESYCNGEDFYCPASPSLPDEQDCLDRGKCRRGQCISYCQTLGKQSCMCDTEPNACKRCCKDARNGTCKPIDNEILLDGTPCIYGFCEKGRCEKTVQDFVERFWDIIEEIDINTFFLFLKDNIVLAVVLSTLIVWFPLCIWISHYDRKVKEDLKRQFQRSVSAYSDPHTLIRNRSLSPQTYLRQTSLPTNVSYNVHNEDLRYTGSSVNRPTFV